MNEQIQVKRVPLNTLLSHPSNYNQHPPAQIADLKASLIRYKQVKPVVVQQVAGSEEQYMLLAGHGITQAAQELYAENPRKYAHLNDWMIAIAPSSWSLLDAKGYMVSDNELGRKAEPDELLLAHLLEEQKNAGFDLASLGSDEESLRQMLESLGDGYLGESEEGEEEESEQEKGNLLALLNVTIAEPDHQVQPGDIWQLDRHTLICAHVIKDWPLWTSYLQDETCLFLPFAGPLVPLSKKADESRLVMVQPDPYIAGHILDRYADIKGKGAVRKVRHVQVALVDSQEEEDEEDEEEFDG